MRFAQVIGLTALVYVNLVESEFLLSYSNKPVYKKDLTEREVHTANGLVNKSVFRRVKKEGKIAFIRNTKINESDIKVGTPLTEGSVYKQPVHVLDSKRHAKYSPSAMKIAKELDVPYEIVAAMIEQESNWNQTDDKTGGTLLGDNGTAKGLLQIRKLAHQEANAYVGRKLDLDNPEDNIRAGVAYLKLMSNKSKDKNGSIDWPTAISKYNAGPSGKGGKQYAKDVAEKLKKYADSFKDPQGHNKQTGTVAPKPKPTPVKEPTAQAPKYGTVEWYKKYGTDPNPAVDA